jgi:hypothetical protein
VDSSQVILPGSVGVTENSGKSLMCSESTSRLPRLVGTLGVALVMLCAQVLSPAYAQVSASHEILDAQGHKLNDPRYELIRVLNDQEEHGLRLFRAGDYAAAYEVLSEPARHGLKRAQHSIALMHIEGQSLDKNPLIGIALIGLAAESGDRKLEREYREAIKTLPKKYRELVLAQTDCYVQRYGMKAQGIPFRKVKRTDSDMKVMKCVKEPGEFEDHAWVP